MAARFCFSARVSCHAAAYLLIMVTAARGGFVNTYSYTQINDDNGSSKTYSNSDSSMTADLTPTINISQSGSTIQIEAKSKPITGTDLHTYSRIVYSTDSTSTAETWKSIDIMVTAEATLVDVGTINGVPGTVTGGTLFFSWAVGGESSYSVTAPATHIVKVDEVRADVSLESTIPGFEDIWSEPLEGPTFPPPIEDETISDNIFGTAGPLVFPVNWTATPGSTIPIEFTLKSSAQFKASPFLGDATIVNAEVFADYFNSANLNGVMITDQNGDVLSGATLNSQNGFSYTTLTAIPEPSSFVMFALSTGICLVIRSVSTKRIAVRPVR